MYIMMGHGRYNFINILFHSLRFYFILANSADPGKILQNTIFYQGLHYLKKYPLGVSTHCIQRISCKCMNYIQ